MTRQDMIDLVNQYFSGVDGEDFQAITETLTSECIFTVETHGVRLQGHDQIKTMFDRLWSNHAAVRHQDFVHVASPAEGRIATRFQVINTHHDGQVTYKSNCNFFEIVDSRFASVAVYMAGQNTLNIS